MMTPKNILITGCSSGIGYTTAKKLSALGHHVIATARQDKDIARLQSDGMVSFKLDLNESHSIKEALAAILEHFDHRLDVLINNAGFAVLGAIEDMPREAIKAQFETNVFGTMELTNSIIPLMRKQESGYIINISSILGLVSMPYRGLYNASKYALEGLSDTLRLELANSNIKVILIEPGPIESRFRDNAVKSLDTFKIDPKSPHYQTYQSMLRKFVANKNDSIFTKPPEAVSMKIIKAITSQRPKAHYYVTFASYLLAYAKRLLPTKWLDYFMLKIHD